MTKAGKSIIKGAKQVLAKFGKNNWIIISVGSKPHWNLILDADRIFWDTDMIQSWSADDNGIRIPEDLTPGVYLMTNIKFKNVKSMWSLDGDAGWCDITGDFKLLYDWKPFASGCKK